MSQRTSLHFTPDGVSGPRHVITINIALRRRATTNAVGEPSLGVFAKGIRPPAQGCCTRLPWEHGRRVRQPQRGCGQASRDNTNQGIGRRGIVS